MSKTSNKAVTKVTRVFGADADTLSDATLIDTLKRLKAERKTLEEVGVESRSITNKIAAIDSDIADIVGVLDDREPADEAAPAAE